MNFLKNIFHLTIFINVILKISLAQEEIRATEFRWNPMNKEGEYLKGKCYEIDIETAGRKYLSEVAATKCRPSEDQITFRWLPKNNAPGGKCYEVDVNTSGEMYSQFSNWKNCIPSQASYVINEEKCYQVGQTLTGPFIMPVSFDYCKSDQITYVFQLAPNALRGTCFEVDQVNQISKKTALKNCRPTKDGSLQITWDPNTATCFEIASTGPNDYIAAISKESCKPEQMGYQWVQSDDPHCLEVGLTEKGTPFENKVDAEKCLKGIERVLQFIVTSPIDGQCFEIDRETLGKKVKRKLNSRKCETLASELEIQLIEYNSRPYCLSIDKKDPTHGYRRVLNASECTENSNEYKWEMGIENPFEGKCLKKTVYNGQEKWNGTIVDFCETEKLRYFWYTPTTYPEKWITNEKKKNNPKLTSILQTKDNLIYFGKCYQIDDLKGPEAFSRAVNVKYCKPKDLMLKYNHPDNYIKGGCYSVDKETQGFKYFKKVLDKDCKDEFLKTKGEIIEENTDYSPN